MIHGNRFRIDPKPWQIELINKTFGCVQHIHNVDLHAREFLYQNGYSGVWTVSSAKSDIVCRKRGSEKWLTEVDSIALQAAVEDLDTAFRNFFRGCRTGEDVGYPKFKSKKDSRQSYRTKNMNGTGIQVGRNAIKLPKLGWIPAKVSKTVSGKILSATVSRNPTGKYFVSICYDDDTIHKLDPTDRSTGVDLGKKDLAILSDGTKFDNRRFYVSMLGKLRKAQRDLSRKQRGSARYEKARRRLARIHQKISDCRLDWSHKLTTSIVREYDFICIEDLHVKGMMKGRGAKHTADAAWGEIRRQLEYKCEWHGKTLVVADRWYASSQTCHCCGHRNKAVKDPKIRRWSCPYCGADHDRDINAAVNLEMYMMAYLEGVPIRYVIED